MKTYRYNTKSKEIHQIDRIVNRCHAGTPSITPDGSHWRECRGFVAWWLLTFRNYNGCRWCWPEKDLG